MNNKKLTNTQVKIYLYIATRGGNVSVRDIARDLNLPVSTVHYNLKRLEELGYIAKSSEGYIVKNPIKLKDYILVGKLLIPRLLIYGLFFTGIFIGTLVYTVRTSLTADRLLLLLISLLATLIFYIEALRTHRRTLF